MAKINVGDRFGKLVVLERAEDVWSENKIKNSDGTVTVRRGKTKYPAWLCKCDCGNEEIIRQSTLKTESSVLRSCGKCPPEKNVNYIPPKMDREEYENWLELYEYVRANIMGYDNKQSLTPDMVNRLQGLATGNYKANNRIAKNANYSYKVILNTFKFCSLNIHKALKTMTFTDERHRFNYICKIVENNINNVYLRMQNTKKAKEKVETMTLDTVTHVGAEYQKKTESKTNKLFDDLW